MAVNSRDVADRWKSIRKNKKCDLALSRDTVAQFMRDPEPKLVRDNIRETLKHLVAFRLESGEFASDEPNATGVLVRCEGLEAFLVPAVEDVLPFSSFLSGYEEQKQKEIAQAIVDDINRLFNDWEQRGFLGDPYADTAQIRKSIDKAYREKFEQVNITESAAMACRVIIHLLTLSLQKPDEEELFNNLIGKKLNVDKALDMLLKAIDFLVEAFQKGKTKSNPIGSATQDGSEGSGWSWTSWPGLPPMLFFTASAVDAFAELDLYLIRACRQQAHEKIKRFYETNKEKILEYQFCVDMSRRWVLNSMLYQMTIGYGFYYESGVELCDKPESYDAYKNELSRVDEIVRNEEGEFHEPLALYNNTYALLILLWSFGDWDDKASEDTQSRSKIERALLQLVFNYGNIPVFQEILNRFPFQFYLPGEGLFDKTKGLSGRTYMDSGFLTLLTRQLVLFGVYGVGDRTVIDPLIGQLYTDLLLNRHRGDPKYAYLWSANSREIFSTQRAVQALTFYYKYVEAKESVAPEHGPLQQEIDLIKLFSDLLEKLKKAEEPPLDKKLIMPDHNDFRKYVVDKGITWVSGQSPDQELFMPEVKRTGDKVLMAFHGGELNEKEALLLLDACEKIVVKPIVDDKPDVNGLKVLQDRLKEILATKGGKKNS